MEIATRQTFRRTALLLSDYLVGLRNILNIVFLSALIWGLFAFASAFDLVDPPLLLLVLSS